MDRRPPELLAISSGTLGSEADAAGWLAALGGAAVDAVQLREKSASDHRVLRLAERARTTLPQATAVLVNGRCDIALAAGADGIHLPAAGIPTAAARRLLGARRLIGRSTHRLEEVESAFAEGADYVTFGPVFSTPSKERYGAPVGLEALAAAARHGRHVVALGGITMDNAERCIRAGAHGLAAIRLFQDRAELARRVEHLRSLFRDAPH